MTGAKMRNQDQERLPSIKTRIWATVLLLLVSVAIFFFGALKIDKQLITEFVAGLLVLATAGIWVSFLAEREARRTVLATAEGIRQASELSRISAQIGLVHIFPNSDDEQYHHFIGDVFLKNYRREEIRMVGVACRGLFHAFGGPNNQQIKELAIRKVPMRVILFHPFFEPAITRGIREDSNRRYFADHPDTMLLTDILLSCDGIIGLGTDSVQARLCPVATGCRATFVGDLLIFEPLHFGLENQRASIDTPVFVFRTDAPFSRQISEHFEFLWKLSEGFVVSPKLVRSLRPQNVVIEEPLVHYLRMFRKDLFGPEESSDPSEDAP
jgi:hypothetical protein